MKIIFIPGLLCTNQVWGTTNKLRKIYDCCDADVVNFDTIDKMSDALISSTNAKDICLIGISMGGYVAIDSAIKLRNRLKKLILINTTANPVNLQTIQERQNAIAMAKSGLLKKIVTISNGICFYEPRDTWQQLEEQMAINIGVEAYVRQQNAIITRQNYTNLLNKITADTLIIAGKNDKVIPYQDSFLMAEKINNSTMLLLNKCGHLSTLERESDVFNILSTFLES